MYSLEVKYNNLVFILMNTKKNQAVHRAYMTQTTVCFGLAILPFCPPSATWRQTVVEGH